MDEDKLLFEKGCFLAQWVDDEPVDKTPVSRAYESQTKDLAKLLSELDEIKARINEVREREWHLARLVYFHNNNLAGE